MKKIFLLLLLIAVVGTAQTKLARYQKKILSENIVTTNVQNKFVEVTLNNVPDASLYNGPLAEVTKRNIFTLSDKGQKAFIEAVNSKSKELPELLKAIPTLLESSTSTEIPVDFKRIEFSKKVEIVVNNKQIAHGRIAKLVIWLTLDDNTLVEFSGFGQLSTKFYTIDYGTVSLNRTTGFTLNAGINILGTGAVNTTSVATGNNGTSTDVNGTTSSNTSTLGGSYSNNRTIAEAMALSNTVIISKGSLNRKEISLMQNGVPNKDLDDNINMEIIFKTVNNYTVPVLKFKGLFKDNVFATDPSKILINKVYMTLPNIFKGDVKGKLSYTYLYRDIGSGENTAGEFDDKINYYQLSDRGITELPVKLVGQHELLPKLYSIITDPVNLTDSLYLNYYGQHVKLYFTDLSSASEFIDYLQSSGYTSVKGFQVEYEKLSQGDVTYLKYDASVLGSLRPIIDMR
ncbi:serpin family protein [Flavobacterium bizetiae]|uniref:hypothetical protein n=1 Tax=Flavobacterium bizetiae TaxID=2704140 RepID=UPI003757814A